MQVAPRVGAWIETLAVLHRMMSPVARRTPCGCVD